jgi:aminocarboxymuconate-semialdehyde decarboxylase
MLEILLELFGTSRVMLGTDYPFPLGEKNPGELICSLPHLSESVQDQLLFQNALEWLGLNLIGESAK